jgi:hypothetical protein
VGWRLSSWESARGLEPPSLGHALPSFSGRVETAGRGDHSMQQCRCRRRSTESRPVASSMVQALGLPLVAVAMPGGSRIAPPARGTGRRGYGVVVGHRQPTVGMTICGRTVAGNSEGNFRGNSHPSSNSIDEVSAPNLLVRSAPRGIRTPNRQIRRQVLSVGLLGSRRICPAQMGCVVGRVGSRRKQLDRPGDHRDDQPRTQRAPNS